jgi:biopolymer transport protein ExbD
VQFKLPNGLRIALAVVLVGLIARAALRPKGKARGFPLYLPNVVMRQGNCGDGEPLVVTVLGNHRFTLNESGALTDRGVASAISNKLQYRAEKFVLLRGEPGISHGDFTEMVDTVHRSDVAVVVKTREVERLERQGGCLFVHVRANE